MLSIQLWWRGGGGALLAAAVGGGRVCRVVGCNQLFFFFAVHNFSTQVFPVFSVFFLIVFAAPRSGDSFPNACEKSVNNIFVPISL